MDYSKKANLHKRKSAVSKTNKAKNRLVTIGFRVIVSVVLLSIFAAGGVAFGAYMGVIESIAHLESIQYRPAQFSSVVLDKHGNEIDRFLASQNREYVTLDQIPLHLQQAFIAIEDHRFFEHNGVDVRGTLRALHVTLTTDRVEGGSTITQQLIKNNVMNVGRNTIETKLQEQFLALRLESDLTAQMGSREAAKNYILELYLNTVNLGGQLYGVQTAARFYFDKDVSDLTLSESAVIAAITQHPWRYNPVNNPTYNRMRQTTVLNRMLDQGFITPAQHAEAIADDVFDRISEFRDTQVDTVIRSYFVDHLFNTLVEDLIAAGIVNTRVEAGLFIHNQGLTIESTMDPRIQSIMEEAFLNDSFFPGEFEISIEYRISYRDNLSGGTYHREVIGTVANASQIDQWVENTRAGILGEHGEVVSERILPTPQPQSAMVVLDHNIGQVRGIVGGRGEKLTNLGLNRATYSRRHPGSVFKMVASYAPAFDLGLLAPGSILIDAPFTLSQPGGNWTPQNHNHRFEGRVNVRRAVAQSMNVVAATTMLDVGIDVAFNYLLNFGFGLVDTDRGPATALGGLTHGVTQLELATAFGAIANGGVLIDPMVYTRVLTHDGEVLLYANQEARSRQVMREAPAYLLTSTMEDVLTQGTGGGARLNTNMAVAGKTGTSQETRDLAFVGYTPYYTASIWLGHDQPRTLRNHGHSHLRLWAHVMNRIHEEIPITPNFQRPPGIVTARICVDSGLLAIPGICDRVHGGTRVRSDIFDRDHVPTMQCNIHGSVRIDTLTGLPVTEDTPLYRQDVVVGEIDPATGLPVDYSISGFEFGYYPYENEDGGIGESPPPVYDMPDVFIPPNFDDVQQQQEDSGSSLLDMEGSIIQENNNITTQPPATQQPATQQPINIDVTPPSQSPVGEQQQDIVQSPPPVIAPPITEVGPSFTPVPEFNEQQFGDD